MMPTSGTQRGDIEDWLTYLFGWVWLLGAPLLIVLLLLFG